MYKFGDLIYFDELTFKDGKKDPKKCRPCIVLYLNEEENKVICMPLTTAVNTRNKRKDNYLILSTIIYSMRKISFVKIDNIITKNLSEVHDYKASINDIDKNNLKNKIKEISLTETKLKYIIKLLEDEKTLILKK